MMNYEEAPRRASQSVLREYANGIRQVNALVKCLFQKGDLPERFTPEPLKLHPSLEGKVRQETITIGGRTPQELLSELSQNGVNVSLYAKSMIANPAFTTLPQPEQIDLVRLQVSDLVIGKNHPTTDQIYQKAQELGLKPCPAEVGPHYRDQYKNQPRDELVVVGMQQIAVSDGYPRVFVLVHDPRGLWLFDSWAYPHGRWDPGHQFVFSLRK
ncbi:MAG: hypothetical protein AAB639_03680 [Patescibacteria group bacterium]